MTTAMGKGETLDFRGRVAIVTGGGRGIGREYCLLLAKRGAAVLVNDLDAPDGGSANSPAIDVAAEITDAGGVAIPNYNSVDERSSAGLIVGSALEAFGRIDILVNNAGVVEAPWEKSIAVNLSAAFWLCKEVWPTFVDQDYGRVLNTTSAAGLFGLRQPVDGDFDFYAYAAAKAGILGLTRSLALQANGTGIRINAVSPVAYSRLTAAHPDPKVVSWLERWFPPSKVASTVLPLLHENCAHNGKIYSAGGGRLAEVVVAETEGYTHADAVPEVYSEHLEHQYLSGDLVVPTDTVEETAIYARCLRSAETGET